MLSEEYVRKKTPKVALLELYDALETGKLSLDDMAPQNKGVEDQT